MSALAVAPGSIFARDFLIERALAEGGMGAVYVVKQLSTGRRRALKLMQPELAHNDDFRRRFLLEAKVGSSIASEHVVEVQQAGIDETTRAPFLVMELLDGVDLHAYIENKGTLSLDETRVLFRQMCHALRLAHQAGIVHRDLKPPNIFLANPKSADAQANFVVKVLDFGIAKMTADATVGAPKTGMIGTPLWMAPEQADHVPITPAADVWALGLILYTCLTGRLFWKSAGSSSLQQIMREMLFDPIPNAGVRAQEQGVRFPPAFETVIARSIVRRPEQRLRDAGAFLDALEEAFAGKSKAVASVPTLAASSGIELDDSATGPSLELAIDPRPNTPNPLAKTALAPTIIDAPPPPQPLRQPPAIEVLHPKPASPTARPVLADGWRAPWWLVFLVPLGVVALFVGIAYKTYNPSTPVVLCRLCTVETGTFANGTMPLRQLRHDIEARFPELDSLCIHDATASGRATIKWAINGGDIERGSASATGGKVGECLRAALTRPLLYGIIADGQGGFGRTEVTYILEWNPSVEASWPPPATTP